MKIINGPLFYKPPQASAEGVVVTSMHRIKHCKLDKQDSEGSPLDHAISLSNASFSTAYDDREHSVERRTSSHRLRISATVWGVYIVTFFRDI
ncbi:hypothetical protein DPMN_115175 [Dreissena polymorpha]|uniref:Uncharacterized protein n=1 Tax=Dreissena polymorpha TaxID=45954 RepID=A0A9D4KKQ6_DREPO|nr:hypothetical protein DPMN_115175 [Dreissena polymorpha]